MKWWLCSYQNQRNKFWLIFFIFKLRRTNWPTLTNCFEEGKGFHYMTSDGQVGIEIIFNSLFSILYLFIYSFAPIGYMFIFFYYFVHFSISLFVRLHIYLFVHFSTYSFANWYSFHDFRKWLFVTDVQVFFLEMGIW